MNWVRVISWALLSGLGLGLCFVLYVGGRAAWSEYRCGVPRRGKVARPLNDALVAAARDVVFKSAHGAAIHGWYAPGTNRAGILLAHGSSGDRTDLLPEARILVAAGYSVLLYDHPGHAESEGPPDWVNAIPAAMAAAVGWLAVQPEVDSGRVGAFGFSMGAVMLAKVAAREPKIAAIVLAGCFTDAIAQSQYEYRRWGPLTQLPALWVMRLNGSEPDDMRPIDDVASLGDRPILIIAGSNDVVVPVDMASELYRAVRGPKELWLIEGVGHGGYAQHTGASYGARLTSFFARALRADGN